MRYQLAFILVLIGVLLFSLAPSATMGQDQGQDPGQGRGKGKGKKGGFNGGFGGQKGGGRGGFQGPGGGPGGFQGRGGFQPPGGGFQGPGGRGGFASMSGPQGGSPDNFDQVMESDFKLRDRNGDGYLNQDEMPDQLKTELTTWDTNRDNLISLDEYKNYFMARMQNRGVQGSQSGATIIVEEEDIETRPVVFRAGKLPKELPAWFKKLDTDKDGQVALYEWRKAGKDIDEFSEWDRNNDGYITAEEALYKQRWMQVASASAKTEDGEVSTPAFSAGRSPNAGGDPGGRGQGKKGGGFNRNKGAE